MNTDVMFSSATAEWATPQEFFDALDQVFWFDLDVCATRENAKTPAYFDKGVDGLAQPWAGTCYMNPPYGREIGKWVQKAYESGKRGATVVCRCPPARTRDGGRTTAPRGKFILCAGGSNSAARQTRPRSRQR